MSERMRNRYDEVPTDSLVGADYNPNTMSKAAFEALVAEVREKGRLMKPVVCRGEDSQLIIVDGHFNWTAARIAGLPTVPIEVIEADEFEARRQTIIRNRTGRKDNLLLGRVYRDMLTERNLNNRELGEMLGVSEGTIRNQLCMRRPGICCARKASAAQIPASRSGSRRTYGEARSTLSTNRASIPAPPRSRLRSWASAMCGPWSPACKGSPMMSRTSPARRSPRRASWRGSSAPGIRRPTTERREFIMWTGMLDEVDQVEKDAYERGYTEGRDATLRSVKAGQAKAPEAGAQPDDEARNGYAERGARIKAAREQRGLSQRQLGELAGINPVQAGLAERGSGQEIGQAGIRQTRGRARADAMNGLACCS